MCNILLAEGTKTPKSVRLMASGISSKEARARNEETREGMRLAPRIRDDLSEHGRAELAHRQLVGKRMMATAAARIKAKDSSPYRFDRIETLPRLPEQEKARKILTTLPEDPGILACMSKHKWNVGCLAEMYPDGKVGESPVCVMGLNQNKGEKILIRIRTDDLKGFRKMLSIRKVLYHELAHNVHSEHNVEFFKLNRQIEKECKEMDWTEGAGLEDTGDHVKDLHRFSGGTYVLGGNEHNLNHHLIPSRELAARSALMRLTAEEEEITQCCGCGHKEEKGAFRYICSTFTNTKKYSVKDD